MQQALPLCMAFLMAFLIVSTTHSVTVEAGRTLAQVGYGTLKPGSTPSVPRGQPYIGGGCRSFYRCNHPPAGAP
uniref:Uncharacterized protein n=1 Tax=Arundo donax TaxID=35708 RepID=A0A0A8Y106_ARUDO